MAHICRMSSVQYSPAIVVLAHNRLHSLQRLLHSLQKADYPDGIQIPLVLSVDCGSREVVAFCEQFQWSRGNCEVLLHPRRLGIRNHVFLCGDLTERYGSIIMLEDDLMVSRVFYNYALASLHFYGTYDAVAGGALFHHQLNETAKRAFRPISDGTDVYFLQLAASWGQFWTHQQWLQFRRWLKTANQDTLLSSTVPQDIKKWPSTSWKKWFTAYLSCSDRYIVYPHFSVCTNFMEPGAHNTVCHYDYQTELLHFSREWRFCPPELSVAKYDSYCELAPQSIQKLNPRLAPYDFEVDLYASKRLQDIRKPLVLTIRPGSNPILGFQRRLRPGVSNIICDLPGDEIQLFRREDVEELQPRSLMQELNYSFGIPPVLLHRAAVQDFEKRPIASSLKIGLSTLGNRLLRYWKFSRTEQSPESNRDSTPDNPKPVSDLNRSVLSAIPSPAGDGSRSKGLRISVVIPNFNTGDFLGVALASIAGQSHRNFEVIVVDGGSTDCSHEVIQRYSEVIDKWVSEADMGQYDAVNKGFEMATGDVLCWLNADDFFYPWTFKAVSDFFEQHPDQEWCMGRPSIAFDGIPTAHTPKSRFPREWIGAGLADGRCGIGMIQQESCFWRRSLWRKVGFIDLSWRLAGDFWLWCEFAKHSHLVTLDAVLSVFNYREGQRSQVSRDEYFHEIDCMLAGDSSRSKMRQRLLGKASRARIVRALLPKGRFTQTLFRKIGMTSPWKVAHYRGKWTLAEEFLEVDLLRHHKRKV
jgi:glycosyltransferase involved in cell wall biosynthesis